MGAFKEEANTFETVAEKSTQIYNDSIDYGYPYNTTNPPSDISRLIDSVNKFKRIDKKSKSDRKFIRSRNVWDGGVSLKIRIAWEKDEGFYFGTQYTISFNKTPKHPSLYNQNCDAFITVEIENYREK